MIADAYWTGDTQDWFSSAYDSTFHHPFSAALQADDPMAAPQDVGGLG